MRLRGFTSPGRCSLRLLMKPRIDIHIQESWNSSLKKGPAIYLTGSAALQISPPLSFSSLTSYIYIYIQRERERREKERKRRAREIYR
ncbi:hypothetical protein CSUI_010974 [Cystoisospora suis]|uniref:Uncharacterized protein n=1 Tax=Cystoisospora suis TaxID=483139 RepID=A0A2C6KFF7_9APIC|nr:hypothetical protein CSUI_010974 [Cystoisospora suis]